MCDGEEQEEIKLEKPTVKAKAKVKVITFLKIQTPKHQAVFKLLLWDIFLDYECSLQLIL